MFDDEGDRRDAVHGACEVVGGVVDVVIAPAVDAVGATVAEAAGTAVGAVAAEATAAAVGGLANLLLRALACLLFL